MGAHHRVYLTTKITLSIPKDEVKNNNLLSFLPKSCQNDFDCVHQEDYIQESPELTDGTKLKFENTFLVFALKKEYLENVHSFLIESLKTAKDVIYAENDNYRELLDEFISTFKKIDIDVETLSVFVKVVVRFIHAAFNKTSSSARISFGGFSHTSVIWLQSLISPDQRLGLRFFACLYTSFLLSSIAISSPL